MTTDSDSDIFFLQGKVGSHEKCGKFYGGPWNEIVTHDLIIIVVLAQMSPNKDIWAVDHRYAGKN